MSLILLKHVPVKCGLFNFALRVPREIRCFCNMPECVGTNYMCKSDMLGCFSQLLPSLDVDRAEHGCVDLLPREKNIECQNVPGSTGSGLQGSLLLCCYEDMCNHIDSPEARSKFNETAHAMAVGLLTGNTDEPLMLRGATGTRASPGYNSYEVWFKAATIAVPICGALILLILVILAIKILKSDPQALPPKFRSKGGSGTTSLLSGVVVAHNPSADTGCGASKKLPLLYHQNDCTNLRVPDFNQHQVDKNEALAKLNTGSDLIDLAKPGGHAAPTCNLYQPLLSPPQLSGHHHNNLYTTENHNGTTAEEKPWIDTAEVVDKLMQEYSLKFQENYPSSNICNSYPN
ncbi:uncharacterized protein isoform X1 [Rhodnius prolixus]|uniref:uncharacterized protein isoform X1 n=1 Tax=Rhodnius prolixus TaxID=13249 RepID=UPI003D18D05A